MSKVETGIPIDPKIFVEKFNKLTLRYLKIYDSLCPQKCEVDSKVNLPDGLEFPFKEIRCLHWLKFPLDELPPDFNPENLIDLRLPYNKIQRVWEAIKVCLHVPSFALIHFFLWSRLFQMKKKLYTYMFLTKAIFTVEKNIFNFQRRNIQSR